MFCSKCGGQLEEGVNFCPKCGAKTGTDETTNNQADARVIRSAASTSNGMPIKKKFMALRVLSIIGFVFYPLGLFAYYAPNITEDDVFGFTFMYFGLAIAHAIVCLVSSIRHKITVMKILSVLGVILFPLSAVFIFSFMYEDWVASQGWAFIGMAYAVAFSIATFVQALKRAKTV